MTAETIIAAVLADGKIVRFEAGGDSMYPVIRSGDRLLVEPADARTLRRGDVVLARLERGLTAHRIVRVELRGDAVASITMRGDNCPADDPPFPPDQLLGRVRAIDRNGRLRSTSRDLRSFAFAARRWLRQRIA